MANEVTISASLKVDKSGGQAYGYVSSKTENLAGSGKLSTVQNIGTSYEQIAFPSDLVTEGIKWVWIKNLDTENYVEIARDASGTYVFAKLTAGQMALIPVNKAGAADPTWYARANSTAINLQVVASGT